MAGPTDRPAAAAQTSARRPPADDPDRHRTEAVTALGVALRGIDLDPEDEQTVRWALKFLDVPTVRRLVSWIEQARRAERRAIETAVTAAIRGTEPPTSLHALRDWLDEQLDGEGDRQYIAEAVLNRLHDILYPRPERN